MNNRKRGVAIAAACLIAALGFASPAAAAGKGNSPTLGSFAFTPPSIDATGGSATEGMSWSVTDKAKGVANIWGDITIRQQGAKKGKYVGPMYDITFGTDWDGTIEVLNSSGNAASSSYTYQWPVPQYTNTVSAVWVVTGVSIRDDKGNTSATGTPTKGSFTAADLVDSAPPSYDLLMLGSQQPDAVYVGSGVQPVDVEFFVSDEESGLAGGSIVFTGPGGATITTPFQEHIQDGTWTCGSDEGGDTHDTLCDVNVTFPAHAATGAWTLTELDLSDIVGNPGRYTTDLPSVIVQVTSNTVVHASNFALTPATADNWLDSAPLTLTVDTTGASGGISTVNLQTTCRQRSTTPTDLGSGRISVPLELGYLQRSCEVTGVELIDGAGAVSVYGSAYGAPAMDLVATETPDTTPPIATSAQLNQTTFPQGSGLSVVLTADVVSAVGVDVISMTVYNSAGAPVTGSDGGVSQITNGPVTTFAAISSLPAGTYTVGFILTDEGDLFAVYGGPGQPTPPWGQLQFTIVAS